MPAAALALGRVLLRLPLVPEPVVEPVPAELGLDAAPTPAGELLALADGRVALLEVPVAAELPLTPVVLPLVPVELPLVLPPELKPWQGATVGEVVAPPVDEMVRPATLQFNGMRCSMIST